MADQEKRKKPTTNVKIGKGGITKNLTLKRQ